MKLAQIEVSKIRPNPANPRGIDIETEDEKLSYLKDSIGHFGVMVPIVVAEREDGYLLIDGERRYVACKALGLPKIPAFILDEDGTFDADEILFRMFQIHHNREQWGPIQQCNALETVYKGIISKAKIKAIQDERARIQAVTEEMVSITGIDERTALNRVYFLRWPRDTKQRLYDHPDDSYWYLCEIEEKLIIPALINYPEYFAAVPADEVRRDLYAKLEAHTVEKSTDVRRVAPFFREAMSRANDRRTIARTLTELRRPETTYADAQDELSKAFPGFLKRDPVSPRRLLSLLRAIQFALDDFDLSAIPKAKYRAKASQTEIVTAVDGLIDSLKSFIKGLNGGAK